MADHGRVIAVGDELLGDEFAEDTLAGATVLQLVDVADFDEAGGRARIGGVVVSYLTVDDEAATMTLAAGLLANAATGDHIDAWDIATDTAAIDRIASVVFDGMADGDAIDCVVAQHLRRELPPGIRGEVGESVLIEPDGDEWRVIDVLGLREQAAVRFWQDRFVVTSVGEQELALTFEPILHSEHLYWNGLYQRNAQWSRAASTITVPDVDGDLKVQDQLVVEYAYLPGASAQHASVELVPFEATGWKHLVVNPADATDRSAPAFDDSTWATSAAAYGNSDTHPATAADGWPVRTTQWDTDTPAGVPYTSIWLRRQIIIPDTAGGQALTVQVRIDNKVDVYWNGVLVGTDQDHNWKTAEFEIPEGDIDPTNTLAIRGEDWGFYGYLDVRVTAGA